MSTIRSFTVTYDSGSDVLYISRRQEPAARGVEDSAGIVWRYDLDGKLIGATVLDFYDHWSARSDELATAISQRFDIPTPQARVVVDFALEQRDG